MNTGWCGVATVVKEKQLSGMEAKNTSTNIILTHKWSATWQNLRSMNLMNIKHPKKNSSQVPQKRIKTKKNKVIQISRYIFKNKKLPPFVSFFWLFSTKNYFLKKPIFITCFLFSDFLLFFCVRNVFFSLSLCNSMSVVCVAFKCKKT